MRAKLIYSGSSTNADMLYATNFLAGDPFIYFSVPQEQGIIVSALEHGRASREVKPGIEVYESRDIAGKNASKLPPEAIVSALSRKFSCNTWEVPYNFPLRLAMRLAKRGIRLLPADKTFFPQRLCKTPEEISAIKAALASAEKAMARVMTIIADSKISSSGNLLYHKDVLTSARLRFEISVAVIKEGAFSDNTIVASGAQAADPHCQGSGPILAHKPIVIDIFPRLLDTGGSSIPPGYWADITRTVVKGRPEPLAIKAFQAVKNARDKAQAALRPGLSGAEIHNIASDCLEQSGFKTSRVDGVNQGFIHSLGHGVGLDIHEQPAISPANNNPLQEGNVITIEPGLYFRDIGGIRLENMLLLNKNSATCLTQFHDSFIIE